MKREKFYIMWALLLSVLITAARMWNEVEEVMNITNKTFIFVAWLDLIGLLKLKEN